MLTACLGVKDLSTQWEDAIMHRALEGTWELVEERAEKSPKETKYYRFTPNKDYYILDSPKKDAQGVFSPLSKGDEAFHVRSYLHEGHYIMLVKSKNNDGGFVFPYSRGDKGIQIFYTGDKMMQLLKMAFPNMMHESENLSHLNSKMMTFLTDMTKQPQLWKVTNIKRVN